MTTTTRSALRQELGLAIGACKAGTATGNGAGGGTTIVDTTRFTDSYANAQLYDGRYALLTSGTYSGQVRRISSYAGSTGTITVADAYGGQVASGVTFEIHSYDPALLDAAINRALPRLFYWTDFYPTLVTDGDMEASGVTNWTGSSCTPTKETSVVKYGTQSLLASNSGPNGYTRTASISVSPGDHYRLEATVRPDNYQATLIAYDVTNAANIATVSYTGREWKRLWLDFSIPSGCRQMQVWLQGDNLNAAIYWDNVILQHYDEKRLALPSWVTEDGMVRAVERRLGWRSETSGVDFVDEERWQELWPAPRVEQDRTAVNPFYIQLPWVMGNHVLRAVCVRPYATLTTDSATTTADKEWVVAAAIMELLRAQVLKAPGAETGEFKNQISAWKKDFQRLCRKYQPKVQSRLRSPWDP